MAQSRTVGFAWWAVLLLASSTLIGQAQTPAPAPTPANDCSPPYYFEGQKKVFKPQCL